MATIDDIISRAQQVRDETTIGANTASRVGGVMKDTADHVKDVETGLSITNSNLSTLQGRVTTAEGNITSLQETVAGHTNEIEALQETLDGVDELITFPNNGYVNGSGEFVINSSYRASDLIEVAEGQHISFQTKGSSAVLGLSSYDSNEEFVPSVSSNVACVDGGATTVDVYIPSGVAYVRVCKNKLWEEPISFKISEGLSDRLNAIEGQIEDVEENLAGHTDEIEALQETLDGVDELITFPNNAYVNASGEVVSSSAYRLSDFITVTEGQHISFQTKGSSAILGLSAYDSNHEFVSNSIANVPCVDGGVPTDVNVVIPSGVAYVRVCKNKTWVDDIYFTITAGFTDRLNAVEKQIEDIDEELANVTEIVKQPNISFFKSTSPRKPCVCFQLDWGTRAGVSYQAYKSILAQYGVKKSTYAVQPKLFNNDLSYMKELYADGQEIALHTDSEHSGIGLDSILTVSEFNALMGTYHKEMIDAGLDYTGCVVLSTNLKSDFFSEIVKHHIWSVAGNVDVSATQETYAVAKMSLQSDYKFPKRLGIELTQEQQTAENEALVANRAIELIDNIVANNGFLIIYGHSYNVTTTNYTIMPQSLEPILQHLQPLIERGEVLVGNTSELIEYYWSKRWNE